MSTPVRHVCGLFDGPGQRSALVAPLIRDGIDAAERIVYLVDSPKASVRELASRLDASGPLASGQLDVRPWADTYLLGGAFSAPRMLAQLRRLIRETGSVGFRGVRIIGEMGWAGDGTEAIEALIAYEATINAIAARPRLSVWCMYDTSRVAPATLARLLPVHDATLTGGGLHLTAEGVRRSSPRDRILEAAALLFAENGIGRTGVDSLIEAAGVAKATFYRHFPSKDALVLAWLRDPRTRWFDRVRLAAEARSATPGELVGRVFDAVGEWLEAEDFLGCPYLNTAVEIPDPASAAAEVIRDYLGGIGAYLELAVAATGHRDAARLGRELHVLLAGSISLGVANRTSAHVRAARGAALQLLREG